MNYANESLTNRLEAKLAAPDTRSEFDLHGAVDEVLADVDMTAQDCGGKPTFYGKDSILPRRIRFGTMAAVGLAAKSVAVAAIWKFRTGEGQDIGVDVRKALRRFACFFQGTWETINRRPPAMGVAEVNPFFAFPLFHETRDGRYVLHLNIYPKLQANALNLLRCSPSTESVRRAILQWKGEDLEIAAVEKGIVMGMVRSNEEFRKELQYTEILSKMPLIQLEKIGDSGPVLFKENPQGPLDGIRAIGMGHVIAGAAIGRDLALYGADV